VDTGAICKMVRVRSARIDSMDERLALGSGELEHTGILIDHDNPTAQRLEQAIHEAGGAIPYSQFMGESLFGEDGYYSAGKARIRGHFITSPELSEGFNTSMGEATRKVWDAMGAPKPSRVLQCA
jgi:hypothetical protein